MHRLFRRLLLTRIVGAVGVCVLAVACVASPPVSISVSSPSADRHRLIAERHRALGLMSRETDPKAAPFSNADLVDHFEKVVFEPETQMMRFFPDEGVVEKRLSKWARPVVFAIGGRDVAARDFRDMRRLARTVSERTGLDVRRSDWGWGAEGPLPNAHIWIFDEVERANIRDLVSQHPRADTPLARRLLSSPLVAEWISGDTVPCMAIPFGRTGNPHEIVYTVILIKAELDVLWREACIHEEFVQSLGLFHDHDDVRPSLFNDKNEFALLTKHDEYLLEILYDPRLRPGMSRAEAMAIVPQIVSEIRPEG